jgi:hypothetical protein
MVLVVSLVSMVYSTFRKRDKFLKGELSRANPSTRLFFYFSQYYAPGLFSSYKRNVLREVAEAGALMHHQS